MFVLGHVVTIADSDVFPDVDLLAGEQALTVMLPDLVSCHNWAYERAWRRAGLSQSVDLVCAHMLGDAFVHHGFRWHDERRRAGWAYRSMGVVSGSYETFFDVAELSGWRDPASPRDSRRGWAHTLVEYAFDQWLADTCDLGGLYEAVKWSALATLADPTWVTELVDAMAVEPSKPLATQPVRYCGALARSAEPDELHLRALAVKFELREDDEVLGWLRGQLRHITRVLGTEELESVSAALRAVVRDAAAAGYPLPRCGRWAGAEEPGLWPLDR